MDVSCSVACWWIVNMSTSYRAKRLASTAEAAGFYVPRKKATVSQRRAIVGIRKNIVSRMRRRNLRTAGFLGIETKFYDTSLVTHTVVAATSLAGCEADPTTINCLNGPTQGDGESNREGRKLSMVSIHVKGQIELPLQQNQSAADTAGVVFIALVLDKQSNGAQLSAENVFVNPTANTIGSVTPFLNLEYRDRFQVLATAQVRMPLVNMVYDGTNVEQQGCHIPFDLYKSLGGLQTTFTGNTEGVSSISDNSLHVIACMDNSSLAPTITYNSRLRFRG